MRSPRLVNFLYVCSSRHHHTTQHLSFRLVLFVAQTSFKNLDIRLHAIRQVIFDGH